MIRSRFLPCAIWLQGEYGLKDVYVGVPTKLGRRAWNKLSSSKLTADEQAALNKSAESVRELQGITELMFLLAIDVGNTQITIGAFDGD